jgi:hypothetical protein
LVILRSSRWCLSKAGSKREASKIPIYRFRGKEAEDKGMKGNKRPIPKIRKMLSDSFKID